MTQATEDYRAAEVEPVTRALPLTYATPGARAPSRGTWALIVLTVLILGASVGIFGIITEHRLMDPSSLWAGTVAVVALAGMGVALGHFMTRSR